MPALLAPPCAQPPVLPLLASRPVRQSTSLALQGGGAVIGPYALGIIQDVESIRHLAELGVVRAWLQRRWLAGLRTAQLPSLSDHQRFWLCWA